MILRKVLLEAGMIPPKNSDIEVSGISTAKCANYGEIAIAFRSCDVAAAKSNIVLSEITLTERNKLLIFPVTSVFESAVSIARIFIKYGVYPDYNNVGNYKIDRNLVRYGEACDIGHGTRIDSFSEIGNNVRIGSNTTIESNVFIGSDTILGDNVIIRHGARISSNPFSFYGKIPYNNYSGIGNVIIGDNIVIGTNTVIQRGTFSSTVIESGTAIGDLVVIGHDAYIGHNCLIVSASGISGYVNIEDNVKIYGQSGVNNFVTIKKGAIIMGKSSVIKDIPAGSIISGSYGRAHKDELKLQAKMRKLTKIK